MPGIGELLGFKKVPVQFIAVDDLGFETVVMQLDASIEETHSRSATVTNIEVEEGTNINDNIVLNPKRLTIEGVVSEAPLKIRNSIAGIGAGLLSGVAPPLGVAAGAIIGKTILDDQFGKASTIKTSLSILENLWESKRPFDILFSFTRYKNMVFTNFDVPRNARSGESFRFNAVAQELKIVKTDTATLNTKKDSAKKSISRGKKNKTDASPSKSSRGSSILAKFTGLGV